MVFPVVMYRFESWTMKKAERQELMLLNCGVALISHASKVMLKLLEARLQQYMNCELPDVQAGFRKGRGTRYQIANHYWIIEKAKEFQETSTSASLTTLNFWLCGSQ